MADVSLVSLTPVGALVSARDGAEYADVSCGVVGEALLVSWAEAWTAVPPMSRAPSIMPSAAFFFSSNMHSS
jgi:hypothetical protein